MKKSIATTILLAALILPTAAYAALPVSCFVIHCEPTNANPVLFDKLKDLKVGSYCHSPLPLGEGLGVRVCYRTNTTFCAGESGLTATLS